MPSKQRPQTEHEKICRMCYIEENNGSGNRKCKGCEVLIFKNLKLYINIK